MPKPIPEFETEEEAERHIRRLARRTRLFMCWTALMASIAAASLALTVTLDYRNSHDDPEHEVLGFARVVPKTEMIYYLGPIESVGVQAVANLLNGSSGEKLSALVIDSPGGNYYAAQDLIQTLNEHHVVLYVTRLCESACVAVFLHTAEHRTFPDAVFAFHQGVSMGVVGLLGRIRYAISGETGTAGPFYMDEWAKEMSPRLLDYFGQCSKENPLRTARGIALRWVDIEMIADGRPPRSCDEELVIDPREPNRPLL